MCCQRPNWHYENGVAICYSCGSTKLVPRPSIYEAPYNNPYIGPTYIPPVWSWHSPSHMYVIR